MASAEGTSVVAATKRYVCDPRHRLRLFETVGHEVRRVAGVLREERFSVTAGWTEESFRQRVPALEEAVADLCRVEALLAAWSGESALETLTLPLRRGCDDLGNRNGNGGWLALRWYPVLTLLYSGGIAAANAGRYDLLRALFHAPVRTSSKDQPLVTAVVEEFSDVARHFQWLPGLERHHTPCSDRLFSVLQPPLDDLLFMGSDFERAFDRFEVFYALEYAHLSGRGWEPVGRFGWKDAHTESNALISLVNEAEAAGNAWPPFATGLCGGSIEKFKPVAAGLAQNLVRRPMW